MNGTYHLDLEKLNKSVETISGIEDCISSRDLSEGFSILENYFRDINFEHGNCLKYKEDIELILNNINQIKRKVSNLADALITTTENYGDIESIDSKDIKELTSIYNNTPASENLGKLVDKANQFRKDLATDLNPPTNNVGQQSNQQVTTQDSSVGINNNNAYNQNNNVTTIPQEEPIEEYTTKTINTVPIGIAIGAAGIVGSIGAVVVNEKYGRKTKGRQLEEIDDDDLEIDNSDNYYQSDEENAEFDAKPYMASRQQREADKYYGNDIILDEDDDLDSNNGNYYE